MKKDVKIKCPLDTLCVIPKSVKNARLERFGIIVCDGQRNVIAAKVLFKGGVSQCPVDLRAILWEMVRKRAIAAIVFHNHPSGSLSPSDYDIEVTKRLESAFNLCGLTLLDHIIVSKHDYWSFKENDALLGDKISNLKVADLLGGSK